MYSQGFSCIGHSASFCQGDEMLMKKNKDSGVMNECCEILGFLRCTLYAALCTKLSCSVSTWTCAETVDTITNQWYVSNLNTIWLLVVHYPGHTSQLCQPLVAPVQVFMSCSFKRPLHWISFYTWRQSLMLCINFLKPDDIIVVDSGRAWYCALFIDVPGFQSVWRLTDECDIYCLYRNCRTEEHYVLGLITAVTWSLLWVMNLVNVWTLNSWILWPM